MVTKRGSSVDGSGGSDSDGEFEIVRGKSDPREKFETYDEMPDFSDPEGFVDDVDDETLMPDLLSKRPKESDGVDNVVVVDGIPVVGAERLEKLKGVLRKIFSKFGNIINEHYPLAEDGQTKGFTFLEFADHSSALEAVKNTNNYKLDKQHVFEVNMFSDFEKYENVPEEWEPPSELPYVSHGNKKSHLLDPDSCDQFSVVHEGGDRVTVYLGSFPDTSIVESRERWTYTYVKWSPLGSYLATFHDRGVALWGGDKFECIAKFSHPGVQFIDFSPCEKYLVTFSSLNEPRATPEESHPIIIWETRTGVMKRSFKAEQPFMWPVFKWSHNDSYFGRMSEDGSLSIYETPSFGLLEKKSVKIAGMKDFSWSPTENILAYWVAEDKDVPARVTLVEIPSRNEVRVKNLFNVADCKMHWQKSGDYLCVKVDRYSKMRREKDDVKYAGLYYNFEVFHMREKQIPVDSVEVKENVHAFAWEPVGTKFAIIHGDMQALSVSFYGVKTGQTPALLKKYERKTANHLFWSPAGQFIVLAGMRTMNGVLEFIDTNDFTVMNSGDHFMCTDIEWDPTGRYVMTGVSWWGHKLDNGYWVWSFQGKILKRFPTDKFCQFLWRPRPPSLLSVKQIKDIKKNLKKYSVEFDSADKIRGSKKSVEVLQKRKAKLDEFLEYRLAKKQQYEAERPQRMALRRGIDTDKVDMDNQTMEEEVVEFLVKEDHIIVD